MPRLLPWLKVKMVVILVLLLADCLITSCAQLSPTVLSTPAESPTPYSTSDSQVNLLANFSAQDLPPLGSLRFERLLLNEGLSQSVVQCILQDSMGFMWFGTQDGLNKYDGYEFTVFSRNPYSSNSLSDRWISVLYEDRKGRLWIGTRLGGLNLYNRESGYFTDYQNDAANAFTLSSNTITGIAEDLQGNIWVGTSNGLNRLDPATGVVTRFQHTPNEVNSLVDNAVTAVYGDRSGIIWVGTPSGLDRINPQTGLLTHFVRDSSVPNSLSSNMITAIYEDKGGVLWVGTANGLNWLERVSSQFVTYRYRPNDASSLSNNDILAIHEDKNGTLWVGTDRGLNSLDRATGSFTRYYNDPNDPYSLSSNTIQSVYVDKTGILWIGTFGGGLNRSYSGRWGFTHIIATPTELDGLNDGKIFPIYEDAEGSIWIGTYEGGLNRLNRRTEKFTHYLNDPTKPDTLSNNHVWAIYQDRGGQLWIGTSFGLDEFERKATRFLHHRNDPQDSSSLSNDVVKSIFEDSQGNFWVGTAHGLNLFDRQTDRSIRYLSCQNPGCISSNNISTIFEDQKGGLWIGTSDNGLNFFDRPTGKFRVFQHDPDDMQSLSNNSITAIYQDSRGDLWIATAGGGLNKYIPETGTFDHYQEMEGLSSGVVCGITEDSNGNLWISTNNGLSKFNPTNGSVQKYDVTDGLQSNEFNIYSYLKTKSGEMYFGGINGVTVFFPEQIEDNQYIPPIVLTSLTQAGENSLPGRAPESAQDVTFYWPRNFFEFEYAALSYTQPEKNQYAYKLEGFDKDWVMMGTRRFGRYTNLPGRTYTLRIKGSNNDGIWNETGIAIKIKIVPPFWETWWFRGSGAAGLFILLVVGFRLRVKSIENRSRELEYQVKERTREIERLFEQNKELVVMQERTRLARDLHDSAKQKAFAALAQLGAARGIINNNPLRAQKSLVEAENLVYEVIQELTFLIQELYPLALKEKGLVSALREYIYEWEERTDIQVDLKVDGEQKLTLDVEQALYRITQESLANIARHSQAKKAEISLRYDPHWVELNISDDGHGFDIEHKPLGLGLHSMRERAEMIGGTLKLESNPGEGTRIIIQAPIESGE